jgi:SPP1 gp7 family putative phage head morphogenesis protein
LIAVDVLSYEPWLEPLATGFVRENVALIKSLSRKHFDDLERRVLDAFRSGRRAESLSRQIREQYGASQKRAMLIARDQIGKLNGNLTRQRQKALGVERYIWRTSQDERVRSLHREREGKEFSWDEPPEDGHPGEPIQCRCTAEPVIDV